MGKITSLTSEVLIKTPCQVSAILWNILFAESNLPFCSLNIYSGAFYSILSVNTKDRERRGDEGELEKLGEQQ